MLKTHEIGLKKFSFLLPKSHDPPSHNPNNHKKESSGEHLLFLLFLLPVLIVIVIFAAKMRRRRKRERRKFLQSLREPYVFVIAESSKTITQANVTNRTINNIGERKTDSIVSQSNENENVAVAHNSLYDNFLFLPPPVYRNQRNPVRLIPFTQLPPDFDFSSKEIEVRSDFIILKEMKPPSKESVKPPSYKEAVKNLRRKIRK
ncbi:uncharacterized protein [Leptinotarsa decemlineata]|uniref:uncharacterized protein n=1 Tax=Leptinotarsa decemlineata TaxID=7539 RepID=UPI000C251C5C|nr:uncharacterized protein LOC111515579 [Leptinotarsa decemlineata]